MIEGVIYKYTSPANKNYIGQTTQETKRRNTWYNLNSKYGGPKITRARTKYTPEKFTYQVLYRETFDTLEEANKILDLLETYYIGYYDSYVNGYNDTLGGLGCNGRTITKETRDKIRKAHLNKILSEETKQRIAYKVKGRKVSKETKEKLSKIRRAKSKKVLQYDLEGNFIKEWNSAIEASNVLKIRVVAIRACCSGKSHCLTANNYIWKWYSDNYPLKIDQRTINYRSKIVLQKDLDNNIINTYLSIREAAKYNNVCANTIDRACKKGTLVNNYKFEFKEECYDL